MVRLTAAGRLPLTEGEIIPKQESWTVLGEESDQSASIFLCLLTGCNEASRLKCPMPWWTTY